MDTWHDVTVVREGRIEEIPEEAVWLANFISPRTRASYRNSLQAFIVFHGMKTAEDLRAVTQAHVIAWRDSMIMGGRTEKTVHSKISALSSLFSHLCEKQIVKTNPTVGVKRPKVTSFFVKASTLSAGQVRSLLESPNIQTPEGARDAAVLHILFFTGCRIAEVASLKVKDFYRDAGYPVLDFMVKGGKRNRVAIHRRLERVLQLYLSLFGHGTDKESPLIWGLRGGRKPLSSRQLNKIFHKHRKGVGLPEEVTPHSARATFITQALENDCPIEAVQRSVGHSRIATTQMYDKRGIRHGGSASLAVQY
ncbi:MAG: tyrosine-type recombinase/integrase [Thermodesulfovibrionales bacterium]|jgi:site-specific recombinase XerD